MAINRNSVLALLVFVAAAAPAFASRSLLDDQPTLTCMTSVIKDASGNDLKVSAVSTLTQKRFNAVQSSVASQGEAACLRMKVNCADANNAQHCTQADSDAKAWKWTYLLTVQPVCQYYKTTAAANGQVKDVFCCSTNGCNMDKALDAATKVLELGSRA